MSDLKQLRLRIKGIKSTKKITKAMQMVAASRLRRAKESLEVSQHYYNAVKKSAVKVIANNDTRSEFAKRILSKEKNSAKPELIIAFAGDRGLCGSFNQSIIKLLKKKIVALEDFLVISIGKRMVEFTNNYCSDNVLAEYYAKDLSDEVISDIVSMIRKRLEENTISSCSLYYNKFHNVINQEALSKGIVPLNIEEDDAPISELEGENIIDELLFLYLVAEIKNALVNSSASEEAARTTSMDNATKNAGELIDKLTLEMNRKRQSVITNELIEIISGAEAI